MRREGVYLAGVGLGLGDGEAAAGFARPEALDVGEDGDNFLVAEGFAEGGHAAFEARDGKFSAAVVDDAVEETVGVVPGVAVAVQRGRGQGAVGLADVPVGLALSIDAVTAGAVLEEDDFTLGDWVGRGSWDAAGEVVGFRRGGAPQKAVAERAIVSRMTRGMMRFFTSLRSLGIWG